MNKEQFTQKFIELVVEKFDGCPSMNVYVSIEKAGNESEFQDDEELFHFVCKFKRGVKDNATVVHDFSVAELYRQYTEQELSFENFFSKFYCRYTTYLFPYEK